MLLLFYCTCPVEFSSHNFCEKYKLRLWLSKLLQPLGNPKCAAAATQMPMGIKHKTEKLMCFDSIVNRVWVKKKREIWKEEIQTETETYREKERKRERGRIESDLHKIYMHVHAFNFFSLVPFDFCFCPFFACVCNACVYLCVFSLKIFCSKHIFSIDTGK